MPEGEHWLQPCTICRLVDLCTLPLVMYTDSSVQQKFGIKTSGLNEKCMYSLLGGSLIFYAVFKYTGVVAALHDLPSC